MRHLLFVSVGHGRFELLSLLDPIFVLGQLRFAIAFRLILQAVFFYSIFSAKLASQWSACPTLWRRAPLVLTGSHFQIRWLAIAIVMNVIIVCPSKLLVSARVLSIISRWIRCIFRHFYSSFGIMFVQLQLVRIAYILFKLVQKVVPSCIWYINTIEELK